MGGFQKGGKGEVEKGKGGENKGAAVRTDETNVDEAKKEVA